jgi:exodeoxyribonuclease-1
MADVEATIFMARLVRDRAPAVWGAMMQRTRKQEVSELLSGEEILCLTEFYGGRPFSWRVTLCGVNPRYDAEHAVFDLENDPEDYFRLSIDELINVLKKRKKVIRVVRANAQPILMLPDLAPADLINSDLPHTEREERAALIRKNKEFQVRVGEAMARRYPEEEPSPLVERQIYDGFSSSADREIMERFHKTDWTDRIELAEQLRDQRMKRLAYRLIYLEKPDVLPVSMRISFDDRVAERLLTDDPNVPWRTIPKAIQEADDLLSGSSDADKTAFLKAVRQFLEECGGGAP